MAEAPQLTEEQRKELEEKLKNMSPEEIAQLQKQQCIFCQILSGKIPSKKVYEDDICFAILDINPATKGHLLLIPKEHYSIMPQLPEETLRHLFLTAKTLSQLLLKAMRVSGTNVFIANGLAAGQRAQHFMIHIIPRKEGDGILDLDSKLIDTAMQENVRNAIENKLNELLGIQKEVVRPKPTPEPEPEPEEEPTEEPEEDNEPEMDEPDEDDETEEESDDDTEESDTDASLDDIANLFR